MSLLKRTLILGFLSWVVFTGCSGGTGGTGCAGLVPIPSGKYTGAKTSNAVNLRISANGFNYLNANWQTLLNQFAPGGKINFPVACIANQSFPVIGNVRIADQGGANCTGEGCGLMDGRCCLTTSGPDTGCNAGNIDVPRNVVVNLTSFSLKPVSPDKIEGTIGLSINTGKIYIDTSGNVGSGPDRSHGACAYLSPVKCSITYDTAAATPTQQQLTAQLKFSVDQKWDQLLAFNVTSMDGTEICGASGAAAKPKCLDPADINLDGENNCGNVYCGAADWGPVKTFVLQRISPMLQEKVIDLIKGQSCASCANGEACPSLPNANSTCNALNFCADTAGGGGNCTNGMCSNGAICTTNAHCARCAPRFLGIEGRVAPGALLGNFGVPSSSLLDMSVAAGGSASVDTGLNLSTRAGLKAVSVADCVPALPAPLAESVLAPQFDSVTSTKISGYHLGIGISKPFLNMAMYEAHQSGAVCISLSSATVGVLNTGLFKTFLPSLGRLATRDGKDAPMMIVLRPAKAPELRIGEGTYDPVTKKPIKPLILLTLPELTIDFYAMIDDRQVRLFSLTADISLPLSLIFEGCSSVTPAIGDLNQLVSNIKTANSEILAEDPKVLADLIPAVIGLAEPAVASALKPFALPAIAGFKLQVLDALGVNQISGSDWYDHLGLYAKLVSPNAQCAVSSPVTRAFVKQVLVPSNEELVLTGKGLPWPKVILDVQALGAPGTAEFSYRVGEGMWTTFLAPTATGELEVSHPTLLLQGRHRIEVRSRMAEDPHGISAPDSVGVTIDFEAPSVKLTVNREAGRIDVDAHDFVSTPDELQYAYRVGDGVLSAFGKSRVIDLEAVEAQGGVEVHVRDAAGLVGVATHKVALTQARGPNPTDVAQTLPEQAAGCSSVGGVFTLLSALSFVLLRRRRS